MLYVLCLLVRGIFFIIMSEKEFGDFYVKYLKTIKRWLRQYFSVEADVEDTAHDIFIRV